MNATRNCSFCLLSFATLLALAAGCSGQRTPGKVADDQPFSGTIALAGGVPLDDVKLCFYPLKPGGRAYAEVGTGGSFSSQALPGEFVWVVEPSEKVKPAVATAAIKKVPAKYLEFDKSRKVKIDAGSTITLVAE